MVGWRMHPDDVAVIPPPAGGPAIEVAVNFGVVTGRRATKVEVDRLAETLLEKVPAVTISVIERHDVAADGCNGCVEQVGVAVFGEAVEESGFEFELLAELVTALARSWVLDCRQRPPEGDLSLAERLAPRTVSLD
jgi:hypothetical protein